MRIKTEEAVFAMLEMQQFKFESVHQTHKENNLLAICKCLEGCKVIDLDKEIYYRARRIYEDSEGIFFRDEIPQNAFDSKGSGVAPIDNCKCGRANAPCEQVLYVAEDIETAIKEVNTPVGMYASVATCRFDRGIKVFDFSPYSEKQLQEYIENSALSKSDAGRSQCWMFMEMQRIMTLPEYSESEYIISRELVRIIKEQYPKVSGIKYISHFTGGTNVAIWDDNKFVPFTEGTIVMGEF